MADKECYILSEKADEARAKLTELLTRVGWGHVVTLGEDSKQTFDRACLLVEDGKFKVSSIWARDPEAVRPVLDQLSGHEIVQYGPFGSKLVGIDRNDKIILVLGKTDAASKLKVLAAFLKVAEVIDP